MVAGNLTINQVPILLKRGYSLIELLLVLAILGALFAIAVPRYTNTLDKSREVALKANLKVMRASINQFASDQGRYPRDLYELVALRYLRNVPIDPITEKDSTWVVVTEVIDGQAVVTDVRSGAQGITPNGVPFQSL